MGKICRETQQLIEEQIQQPVERWVTSLETTCRPTVWWAWLHPGTWFCYLIVFVVRVIDFIVLTVVKWVARVVCEVVDFILDFFASIINVILSIPVIGGILRTILNWTLEIFWRIVQGLNLLDLGLTLVGVQIPKRIYVKVIILNRAGIEGGTGPLTTEAALMPHINAAQTIYKTECNIDLIYRGACFPAQPTPGAALTVDCGVEGFFEDWQLAGAYYEQVTNLCAFEDGWRRVTGLGGEIIVFVVGEVTPSRTAGCSFGPTHNYVAIEARTPQVLAHEIGHACGLILPNMGHHPSPNNLMFASFTSTATTLNRVQRAIVRNSRHCTFL
jgi:hypothetical protein